MVQKTSGLPGTPSSSSARSAHARGHSKRQPDPSKALRTYSHYVTSNPRPGMEFKKKQPSASDDLMIPRTYPMVNGELPRSVRNAPIELRAAIRRRQNNESAKRSRERRKEERELMEKQYEENELRIGRLEKQVDDLSAVLMSKPSSHKRDGASASRARGHGGHGGQDFYGVPF